MRLKELRYVNIFIFLENKSERWNQEGCLSDNTPKQFL